LAGAAAIYLIIGIYAGMKLLRSNPSDTLRFDLFILIVAIALSCWQLKLLPYAAYLAVPLAAVWLTRSPTASKGEPLDRRAAATIAAGVALVVGIAAWLTYTAKPSEGRVETAIEQTEGCTNYAAIRPLARLAPGLAVADINLGPYLVAETRLDALSAPYHRLDHSIIVAHEILHFPPAEAETLLRQAGARYVIVCPGLDSTGPAGGTQPDTLLALLLADKPPPFLEAVALPQPTPLRAWSVVP
jgi:hypothetical protein